MNKTKEQIGEELARLIEATEEAAGVNPPYLMPTTTQWREVWSKARQYLKLVEEEEK